MNQSYETMKNFLFLLLPFLFFSCSGLKNGGNKKGAQRVPITHSLVSSIHKGDGLQGVQNLRFRFEQEFVLTLADTAGNGVRKVTPQGNVVLLSEQIVRFPKDKLGKFTRAENALSLDKQSKITFEQGDELYTPELGVPELNTQYVDSTGYLYVLADFLFNGKPAVKYQNAIYYLPGNYKTIKFVAVQEGKGRQKIVKGVKTPAQGG